MNVKKNVLVALAVVVMVGVAAGAINISMSYAKDYDDLTNEKSPTEEKKQEEEYLAKKVTYDTEHGWGVLYEEGVDFDEGITVATGIFNATQKIEELHAGYKGYLDFYVNVWNDKVPTLESKLSWGMTFVIKDSFESETTIVMEVDRLTGTSVERSSSVYVMEKVRTIGRFEVRQQKLDSSFDFNEGITVEKAIQLVEEKAKVMYGIGFSNEVGISNNSVCLEENEDDWHMFSTPEGQVGNGIITADINKFTGQITALSYMPNDMSDRVAGTLTGGYVPANINFSASAKEVKEEILKYISAQQSSEYHQVAIDFIQKHNLNQGATIEKVQGIVESDTMLQLDFDKNSWKYLVETELDNGKYIIVEVEKATPMAYGYYETSVSLEERIDFHVNLTEEGQWIFE